MKPLSAAVRFRLNGKIISCERCGNGHINDTYRVITDTDNWYTLQKLNTQVFKDPISVMRNIVLVTQHLRKKAKISREVLTLIPTIDGKDYIWEGDECWRVFVYDKNSICLETASSPEDFYESAFAFGNFQRMLSDFPVYELADTIPNFHHTVRRYQTFEDAVKADMMGRAASVQPEIDEALDQKGFASTLVRMTDSGELPLRVTHNDTKLNNVLFDIQTHKSFCVIDLDTVMPGLVVNDFGDSIRFGAVHSAEDEKDLSKVFLDTELFKVYAEGFLKACGSYLSEAEIEMLPVGAKMMTLECGVRFLTDYLSGDTYFRISYPEQNLDRARTQLKLAADMDNKWDEMQRIIRLVSQQSRNDNFPQ